MRDQPQFNQVTVRLKGAETSKLFAELKSSEVKLISEVKYNLEKHFKKILNREKENSDVQ